ncbi:hypothetical protein Vretimale_7890 [Volvox reticuliferus]|nr:hypothetical protein Vretifemale_5048 [Volvox reticuliferus]GIM03088.1 hypothetical protein Vretimale_7890 [Volvox reticuliferus]
MRSAADGLVDRRPARPDASARRSSSDGFSKSSSWASGAETSQDNDEREDDCGSGVAEAVQARAARHCAAHPSYLHTRAQMGAAHNGVHITFVRRDADGRTIQLETQPLRGGLHRDYSLQQENFPYCTLIDQMVLQGLVSGVGGLGQSPCPQLDTSGDEDDQEGAAGVELDQVQLQTQIHATHKVPSTSRQGSPRGQQEGCAIIGAAAQGWDWGGHPAGLQHPGIAPLVCRRARSGRALGQQQCTPQFSRFAPSPFGSVPLYSMGGAAVSSGNCGKATGRARRAHRNSSDLQNPGAPVCLAKDPLDLLAEAACDVLDSPGGEERHEDVDKRRGSAGFGQLVEKPMKTEGKKELVASVVADTNSPDLDHPSCGVPGGGCDVDCDPSPYAVTEPHPKPESNYEGRCGRGEAYVAALLGCASPTGHDDLESGQLQLHGAEKAAPAAAEVLVQQGSAGGDEQFGMPSLPVDKGNWADVRVQAAQVTAMPRCDSVVAHGASVDGAVTTRSASVTGLEDACGTDQGNRPLNGRQSAPSSSADFVAAQSSHGAMLKQALHSPSSMACVESTEKAMHALSAAVGGDVSKAIGICAISEELRLPETLLVVVDCGNGGNVVTAPASGSPSICAAKPDDQLPLYTAGMEAELASRAAANVAAANLAVALLHEQQARLPLNAPTGSLGLAIGHVGGLPSGLPLAALALPGALVTPPSAPPPLLWPDQSGSMDSVLPGAPALTAAAVAAPLLTDASALGGALAGAGAAGGAPGQLLPMMRLLQMQLATRGLDPNSCRD